MNVHVVRVAARHRRDRLDRVLAACIAALFFGLFVGRAAHAQEPFSTNVGIGNASYATQAIPVVAASGNVAAAAATATLPAGTAAQFTYITGFEFTSAGATAASVVNCTITGIKGGTLTYTLAVVAGVTTGNPTLAAEFNPALPSSAQATAIVASCPSLGAGNTNATMVAHGFQQ